MRAFAMPILLCGLSGCPAAVERPEAACPHQISSWYGGLRGHLHRAGDGVFDYRPDAPWSERVAGAWHAESGAFSWSQSFADGYFLVSERVVGGGLIEADGDHLLEYSSQQLDVLGVVEWRRVSERRRGCEIERSERVSDPAGQATVESQLEILDDDTLAFSIQSSSSDYMVTGQAHSDLSTELYYQGHDGESWYDVLEPGDGTRVATFWLRYSGGYEDGGYERDLAGTREYVFDRFPDEGDWQVLHIWWLQHYDGSGQGQVVGEGESGTLSCCYEWDAQGEGWYECDDGSSGPY